MEGWVHSLPDTSCSSLLILEFDVWRWDTRRQKKIKNKSIFWIACWFHCRANLTWVRRNSDIDQMWHEMKYSDAPKLWVSWKLPPYNTIYHIVSNILFSWYSLDKPSPHNGNSKILVRTSGWKKKKREKNPGMALHYIAHGKVVWLFAVLVGNVYASIHFNH